MTDRLRGRVRLWTDSSLIPFGRVSQSMNNPGRSAEQLGDDELVALALEGERRAFEALVERYKEKAYRIAFNFSRDREEAKDLSQEAFLKAYSKLRSFDQRSGFYTWFYRILVNLCLDHHRHKKKIQWESLNGDEEAGRHSNVADKSPSLDEQVTAMQLSQKIQAALALLPLKQRMAFVLRNHQGLSIQEIAEIMQAAEGTVKVHLHRAVTTLRGRLAPFVQGG